MRAYVLAIVSAALFALPTAAFSQAVEFVPAGVRIYPYDRPYERPYRRHYEYGADCRELRQACLHKEELGEQGQGNCFAKGVTSLPKEASRLCPRRPPGSAGEAARV
jgi:hypothetical protein